MVGLCGGFEWASWIVVIYLYYSKEDGKLAIPVVIGFILNYILNIVNLILTKIKIHGDLEFQKWY